MVRFRGRKFRNKGDGVGVRFRGVLAGLGGRMGQEPQSVSWFYIFPIPPKAICSCFVQGCLAEGGVG